MAAAVSSKRRGKEFAPGIPRGRPTHPIPIKTQAKWRLAVQRHDALKAGPHWDLRLVDPSTGHAHSWAIPKMVWPDKTKRKVLAIQQPTHSVDYATLFSGPIAKGTYGAGTVKKLMEHAVLVNATPHRLTFDVPDVGPVILRRTGGNKWLLMPRKTKQASVARNAYLLIPRKTKQASWSRKLLKLFNPVPTNALELAVTGATLPLVGSNYVTLPALRAGRKLGRFLHRGREVPFFTGVNKTTGRPVSFTQSEVEEGIKSGLTQAKRKRILKALGRKLGLSSSTKSVSKPISHQ